MTVTIGILGTGSLAGLMVRGLQGAGYRFVLSPRGAGTAARLAERFGCEIAASNQQVVDGCDGVFVSLPAASGLGELSALSFPAGLPVLSAMAGTRHDALARAIGTASGAMAMMPGYANALNLGPSILFPASAFWQDFLSHAGPVHVLATEDEFRAAAAFGAFSGASFGWMTAIIRWFEAQGLPPETARRLVAGTLRGNAEVLLREEDGLEAIAAQVATPGGITERLLNGLAGAGALKAWDDGLDAVRRVL